MTTARRYVSMGELTTIRISCRRCHGIAELPLVGAAERLKEGKCPFCRERLWQISRAGESNLATLAAVVENLARTKDPYTVELVIPAVTS